MLCSCSGGYGCGSNSIKQTDILQEPLPVKNIIDINLTSVVLFSRMALAYMKASPADSTGFSKSIVLVSSIAGITEAPGLFSYSAAKHGVIGMMRALRPWAPPKYGVRANAICPWATDTQLLAGVRAKWVEEKMPMNQPVDVARMIVQCAADGGLNGKAIFVTGGRGFDTEEGIDRTQPEWMGKENAVAFHRGQEILGLVSLICGSSTAVEWMLITILVWLGRQLDRLVESVSPQTCPWSPPFSRVMLQSYLPI